MLKKLTFIIFCLKNSKFTRLPKYLVKRVSLMSMRKVFIKNLVLYNRFDVTAYIRGCNMLMRYKGQYSLDLIDHSFIARDLEPDSLYRSYLLIRELRIIAVQKQNMEALIHLYKIAPVYSRKPYDLALKTRFTEFTDFCEKNEFY